MKFKNAQHGQSMGNLDTLLEPDGRWLRLSYRVKKSLFLYNIALLLLIQPGGRT